MKNKTINSAPAFFIDCKEVKLEASLVKSNKITGQNFLVLPGFWGDFKRVAYINLIDKLIKSGTVLSVNLRGHGKSNGLFTFGRREGYDMKFIFDYLQENGMTPVTVLGFSMGGWITAEFLSDNGNISKYVSHLVMICTPFCLPWIMPLFYRKGLFYQLKFGGKGLVRTTFIDALIPKSLEDSLKRLDGLGVSVIQGGSDWLVQPFHGKLIYKNLSVPKRYIEISDRNGLHAEMLLHFHTDEILNAAINPPVSNR